MARRTLPWSMARLDIQADRTLVAEIRECPLRITGLRRPGMLALSCWRGRSGRRYVVSVHPFQPFGIELQGTDAIYLAVRRLMAGSVDILCLYVNTGHSQDLMTRHMYEQAQKAGANELHIYRLAETDSARTAIATDLC